jgi:hypothetical protein
VIVQVKPGVQAGAAWAARHGVREVLGEQHATPRKRIELRRFNHRVAQRAKTIAAPLISGNQEYVASVTHGVVCRSSDLHHAPVHHQRLAGDDGELTVEFEQFAGHAVIALFAAG